MRKIWCLLKSVSLLAVTVLLVSACSGGGGGGSSQTVSGVAAAGAPVVGFAYLKDSTGTTKGPVTIASDGGFSFDVTGLTAPFFLQAQGAAGGQSFTLHSLTLGAGTANINPLTNLVVSKATGGMDPAAAFANPSTITTAVNQAAVNNAITAIQTALAPLLQAASVSTAINPISDTYVANSTNKLDAMFDAVTIAVAPSGSSATVTVTDKSGASILPTTSVTADTSTIASTISSSSATSTVNQTMTDSQGITSFLQNFAGVFNSKGANLTTSDVAPYYYGDDTTFGLNDGYTRTQTMQDLVANLTGKIIQARGTITTIANVALVLDVTSNYATRNNGAGFNKVYRINADFVFQDGSFGSPKSMTVAQVVSGGPWLFIGNGHKIDVEIRPYANQLKNGSSSANYKTGMYVYLEDVGNLGINSASLEGPGLPTGGLTFSKAATYNNSNTRLSLDSTFMGTQQVGDSWGQYEMTDSQIGQMVTGIASKGLYVLKLYSGTTAPSDRTTGLMQTMNPIMRAAPVLNSNFTTSSAATWFPAASITNFNGTLAGLMTMMSSMTSLPFSYTLPTAYVPAWMSANIDLWDNSNNNQWTDMELNLKATSASATIVRPTFTPMTGALGIEAEDSARRYFRTIWVLQ